MRIHLLRFIILGTTALTACSSDQIIMESVTLSDLANTGCETTYSAKESRPEFYAKEKRKSPKMTISVGGNGVATFHLTNLEYDCITEKIDARLDPQGNTIKIVIAPYKIRKIQRWKPIATADIMSASNFPISRQAHTI